MIGSHYDGYGLLARRALPDMLKGKVPSFWGAQEEVQHAAPPANIILSQNIF
jgi:hypothetical protein